MTSYRTKEEVEKEVKYLPVLYNASKGDIEHFQSFVTKTRLSDLESIIEAVESMKFEGDLAESSERRHNTAINSVLSYLKSLKQ